MCTKLVVTIKRYTKLKISINKANDRQLLFNNKNG